MKLKHTLLAPLYVLIASFSLSILANMFQLHPLFANGLIFTLGLYTGVVVGKEVAATIKRGAKK
ncbi:MAG: hypothetical protein Unbinned6354contig1000_35 [Prokaryotic dsDNA virus sp.]|nr:hypothetical protein [Cytophagaceae bacterium]QDP54332.1 MAG: hypothetical protein Unbinned6354contig1000_35 [Prokaryotic dsDNA virus sp.]|tara:strand:- start:5954 stop:6145 length:192 start_codon:yes stop_codon:yes gene_type:complete